MSAVMAAVKVTSWLTSEVAGVEVSAVIVPVA